LRRATASPRQSARARVQHCHLLYRAIFDVRTSRCLRCGLTLDRGASTSLSPIHCMRPSVACAGHASNCGGDNNALASRARATWQTGRGVKEGQESFPSSTSPLSPLARLVRATRGRSEAEKARSPSSAAPPWPPPRCSYVQSHSLPHTLTTPLEPAKPLAHLYGRPTRRSRGRGGRRSTTPVFFITGAPPDARNDKNRTLGEPTPLPRPFPVKSSLLLAGFRPSSSLSAVWTTLRGLRSF
jgi:hypothetical protein